MEDYSEVNAPAPLVCGIDRSLQCLRGQKSADVTQESMGYPAPGSWPEPRCSAGVSSSDYSGWPANSGPGPGAGTAAVP